MSHKEHVSPAGKFPIVLLTDNLMGDANIGSLFRLADAFNIERIVFTGTPANLNSNRLKRTARATFNTVNNEYIEDPLIAIKYYLDRDYRAIALEITEDSQALKTIAFNPHEKILLIVGNERHGISKNLLEHAALKVHITMFGQNSSMNVSQATGIALYEITKILHPLPEK